MNLSTLKKTKTGSKIVFQDRLPAFTVGKAYMIKQTTVGRMIIDDNGLEQYLAGTKCLFEDFEIFNEE